MNRAKSLVRDEGCSGQNPIISRGSDQTFEGKRDSITESPNVKIKVTSLDGSSNFASSKMDAKERQNISPERT